MFFNGIGGVATPPILLFLFLISKAGDKVYPLPSRLAKSIESTLSLAFLELL
jgi:hypothetical protein